jgi:CRISPR-associated protein Cmr1
LRELPKQFEEPPAQPVRPDLLLELDVSIMTAMYGGGAEAGRNDAFDPFRIPSIRGHLRFWWRATRGGRFTTTQALREAEGAVWGDTDRVSPVKLRILSSKAPVERPAAQHGPDGRWTDEQPKYVLFPAQENRKVIGKVYRGGGFRLEVRTPEDLVADVDSALWAWFTFGGIGGRTRRGCGALYCKAYAHTWKSESLLGAADRSPRDWPILSGGAAVMGASKSDWNSCWESCIRVLQSFRQDRIHPRGRSNWPEPDEIRRLRNAHSARHEPVNQARGFPRAALGLPIIFQFKTPGDPEPNTLNVVDKEGEEWRMASPVILKPWAISAAEAIPLLVALNTKTIEDQLLSSNGAKPKLVLKQKHEPAPRPVPPPGREAIDRLVRFAAQEWKGQVYPL